MVQHFSIFCASCQLLEKKFPGLAIVGSTAFMQAHLGLISEVGTTIIGHCLGVFRVMNLKIWWVLGRSQSSERFAMRGTTRVESPVTDSL